MESKLNTSNSSFLEHQTEFIEMLWISIHRCENFIILTQTIKEAYKKFFLLPRNTSSTRN